VSSWYNALKEDVKTTTMPKARRMVLFMFVLSHPEVKVPHEGESPTVPSWRKLLHSWNEHYPHGHQWQYPWNENIGWDPRNLKRDFLKAYDQVVNFYR
jgi:hypothetical protein